MAPSATSAKPQTTCVTPDGSRSQPATSLCQKTTVRLLAATSGQDEDAPEEEEDGGARRADDPPLELLPVELEVELVLALASVVDVSLLLPPWTQTATTTMIAMRITTGSIPTYTTREVRAGRASRVERG